MPRAGREGIMKQVVAQELIENRIFVIRGHKVMLDRDLAELYQVETKSLNRQVKRNIERFPKEFMFQLTIEEKNELVPNWHRFESLKHSSVTPYAFTEHGVAMLASALRFMGTFHLAISYSFSMTYNRTQSTTEIISHAK